MTTDVTCSNCNPSLQVFNKSNSDNSAGSGIMLAQVPVGPLPTVIPDSYEDGYDEILQGLPTTDHMTKIAAGKSANIDLPVAQRQPANADDLVVDLIVMQTDNLFPVKRTRLLPQSCAPGGTTEKCQGHDCYFSDLTITADDKKAMESALDYYRFIITSPDAKEVQALVAILTSFKDDTITLDQVEQEVNSFFAKLPAPYNACTFDAFATVISYAQNYAPIWADQQSTYTYQVYTPNDPKDKIAWTKLGTITLTQNKSAQLNDPTAGYDIVYTSAQDATKTVNLTIRNGFFVDKENPVTSTISLTGIFKLKSDFTLNTDDNTLLPALAGTLSGKKVLAIALDPPAPPSDPPKPDAPAWDLVNAIWANQVFKYLAMIAAIAGFVLLLYKLTNYIRSKCTDSGAAKAEEKRFKEAALKVRDKVFVEQMKTILNSTDPNAAPNLQPLDNGDYALTLVNLQQEQIVTRNLQIKGILERMLPVLSDNINSLKHMPDDQVTAARSRITALQADLARINQANNQYLTLEELAATEQRFDKAIRIVKGLKTISDAKQTAANAARTSIDSFREQLDALANYNTEQPILEARNALNQANTEARNALSTGNFQAVLDHLARGQGIVNTFSQTLVQRQVITNAETQAIEASKRAVTALEATEGTTRTEIANAEAEIRLAETR